MAIYHLHVKVIGRNSGSSAVASAAYRSALRMRDDRLDRSHDFSGKRGVVHSEVMLPEHAPEAWSDRERRGTILRPSKSARMPSFAETGTAAVCAGDEAATRERALSDRRC